MIGRINFSPKKVSQEETWKPDPSWVDIEKILNEDTEDYPVKIAVLVNTNISSSMTIQGAVKYKTDKETIETTADTSHTLTADNFNTDNYMQYIIYYFESSTINECILPVNSIYTIIKGNITINNQIFDNLQYLYAIKFLNNCIFNAGQILECRNLRKIDGILQCKSSFNLDMIFFIEEINIFFTGEKGMISAYYSQNLKKIYVNKITSLSSQDDSYNYKLNTIFFTDKDCENSLNNMINSNYYQHIVSLEGTTKLSGSSKYICYISNIGEGIVPVSGLNLSYQKYLTKQSLLNLINNMEGTGSITFGSDNLWKLSEDEKQMIIDKGWTYA